MKVTIDEDACIGCGDCEALCPAVFEVGDDGLAHIITPDPAPHAGCVVQAEESCPQGAILVDDK